MKYNNRAVHRDIAYFFFGLIIAFALSGVFLNHRRSWNPRNFTYKNEAVSIELPQNKKEITKDYLIEKSKKWACKINFGDFE